MERSETEAREGKDERIFHMVLSRPKSKKKKSQLDNMLFDNVVPMWPVNTYNYQNLLKISFTRCKRFEQLLFVNALEIFVSLNNKSQTTRFYGGRKTPKWYVFYKLPKRVRFPLI